MAEGPKSLEEVARRINADLSHCGTAHVKIGVDTAIEGSEAGLSYFYYHVGCPKTRSFHVPHGRRIDESEIQNALAEARDNLFAYLPANIISAPNPLPARKNHVQLRINLNK
jgi:hypothetical protein